MTRMFFLSFTKGKNVVAVCIMNLNKQKVKEKKIILTNEIMLK
jgi:hypothetical protein